MTESTASLTNTHLVTHSCTARQSLLHAGSLFIVRGELEQKQAQTGSDDIVVETQEKPPPPPSAPMAPFKAGRVCNMQTQNGGHCSAGGA